MKIRNIIRGFVVLSSFYFSFVLLFFCGRVIGACFIIDILQQIIVSLTVSFFIGFRIDDLLQRVLLSTCCGIYLCY